MRSGPNLESAGGDRADHLPPLPQASRRPADADIVAGDSFLSRTSGDPRTDASSDPSRRRKRAHVATALDAVPLSRRLRLQAPVHAQRVLRPRPQRLLPRDPERSRARPRSDELARVLRGRALDPTGGGQSARNCRDPRRRRGACSPTESATVCPARRGAFSKPAGARRPRAPISRRQSADAATRPQSPGEQGVAARDRVQPDRPEPPLPASEAMTSCDIEL